jgi:hypothetical protein
MQVSRTNQWWMIGGGYAVITVYSAGLLYARHRDMLQDPTIASSGMYAAGDAITVVYLFFLYMIPTAFALRLLAVNEPRFEKYSLVLLAVSATAPLALGLAIVGWKLNLRVFEGPALERLMASPMVFITIAASRFAAKSEAAKRWTNYALLTETLTFLVIMILLIFAVRNAGSFL